MKPIEHPIIKDALHSLILSNPFFACLLLQQEFVETTKIKTMAVDGKHLFYNKDFADLLKVDTCKAVLVHEGQHLMLLHHARMGNRDPKMSNEAMDYAINPSIEDSGFKLPRNLKDSNGNIVFEGPLLDRQYANMSFEDIYAKLREQKNKDKQNKQNQSNGGNSNNNNGNNQPQNGNSNGNGNQPNNYDPSSLGEVIAAENPQEAEEETKIQVAKAELFARSCGKIPDHIARAIDSIKKPKHDWKEMLWRFITEICAKDYSFLKPNKRFLHSGFILPTLYNKTFGNFIFVVDTSGSITSEQLNKAVSEIFSCLELLLESKSSIELPVIYCDCEIKGMDILTDTDTKPMAKGGGGTAFKPAFDYIKENKEGLFDNPAAIFYLTDGINGLEVIEEPNCPVLWLVTTDYGLNNYKRPFGEDVRFDIDA